jgi:HEAT repeat protein
MSNSHLDIVRANQLMDTLLSDPEGFYARGDGNELLKQFLRGYSLDKLRSLLHHPNERVVATGIWISSELGQDAAAFVNEAVGALQHPNKRIRYFALDVIMLGTTTGEYKSEFFQIVKRLEDADVAVRQKALELLSRAIDKQLISAIDHFETEEHGSLHPDLLHRLLRSRSSDPAEIEEMIRSGDRLRSQYGIAIAERVYDIYPHLLNIAANLEDEEYGSIAKNMLKQKRRRRSH